MELATFCFGCSGHEFDRRISIGLTNDNATDKIRDMEPLEDILIQYWLQCDVCLGMYHHIHLKMPRTVPHTATASPYDGGVITYLFLCPQKTKLRMRTEAISMVDYRINDETIGQGMTPIVSAIEVGKSLPYLAVQNKKTSVIN